MQRKKVYILAFHQLVKMYLQNYILWHNTPVLLKSVIPNQCAVAPLLYHERASSGL